MCIRDSSFTCNRLTLMLFCSHCETAYHFDTPWIKVLFQGQRRDSTMEDQNLIELVTAAQNGDREAFGSLVVQFESTVFAIVMKRLRNHAEASEVTQDVFIQAMRKLSQLNAPERFGGWLRQIACLLYTSPSPRDRTRSRMPSSA
eukprot:TRINITY_DN29235_c0_g1_i1.p1 TRINITY_DN29235_c0_g1~~TRINITY_DN29235_c0_g1_i1.p1  ORF type:complete len:145 (-),score=26.55 TRINITY_DN29235_c0_g1_i1:90-524(-)